MYAAMGKKGYLFIFSQQLRSFKNAGLETQYSIAAALCWHPLIFQSQE